MDWSSIDPTAACLGLLVLSLTLIWTYVFMGRGNRTPTASLEVTSPGRETKGSGGRKRGKAKTKQVGMQV